MIKTGLFFLGIFWLVFVLVGCASGARASGVEKPGKDMVSDQERNLLLGSWFGEVPIGDGEIQKWLMVRRLDGGYTVTFQTFKNDKKIQEQTEAGYWGVVGDIYFTVSRERLVGETFRQEPVTDSSYYDAYKVLNLDKDQFRYRRLVTGKEYEVRKVPDSFRIE